MGAIAIITTVLAILLIIGSFGLIIGIGFLLLVKLLFKTKKKLFIILPVIVIILSLIPFIGSLIGISHFRSIINESQEPKPIIDTGVKIYWKYENRYKDNEDEYFVYNNKKYIYLTGYLDRRPDGIEIDSPVANIIRKEENVISKIFIFIFNVKDYENILYTIKNYPDDSLLIMDNRNGAIYCEENKYIYYENMDYFSFYATYGYGHLPDIKESIHLNNEIIVNEIYAYSTNVMQLPPPDKCNFIFVFGISNDNIFVKEVASIIIYNNEIYKEFGYFSAEEERGVALLNKEQSEYISKIIIENKWQFED